MRKKGKIISWNDDKGYGFISPHGGGKKIFVHISAFDDRGRRPVAGQAVSYGVSKDRQGRPCAVDAALAGGRPRWSDVKGSAAAYLAPAALFLCIVGIAVIGGNIPPIILITYVVLSLLTYFAYAADKSAAQQGRWRTQESTLHLLALAGGWPGALAAQQRLRHKSSKTSFRLVFWVTVAVNIGAFAWLFTASGAGLLNSLLDTI